MCPKLHTVLEVGPNQCSVEWDNHVPRPASCTLLDAPLDTVGPLDSQDTQLTHIQLAINLDSQISFCWAALIALIASHCSICMYNQDCPIQGGESGNSIHFIS